MANAGKGFGPGQQDQGKGDGGGAMTPERDDVPENSILSNRDTARHSDQRGLDSRHVQNEQRHDHPGNRDPEDDAAD